uniref:glycosyltransferase n=1 Tax=Segatella copri TaxID=165179 RepID=UPI003FEE537C
MKRILFIAPDSYPVTGAESIVNIKLLEALCATDEFEIDLVSRKRKWSRYPSDSLESFGVKLNSINIIEYDNKANFKTLIQSLRTFLKFGAFFKGCHWAIIAYSCIENLLRNNKYDYVLTKNTPSYLLGAYVQKKFGIKWIATWNDPYPGDKYPAPYGLGNKCKEGFLMKREIKIMKEAYVHVFPNDRIKNFMQEYLRVDDEKTVIIPHAILENRISSHVGSKDNKLRLIHSGNLGNPRNPLNLLKALDRFVREISTDISLTILGHPNKELSRDVAAYHLEDYVKYLPPVEYKQSVSLLQDYDVAVIVEANCEEGIFLPTKVSDFMQARIPIFSISPSVGVLNDLYKEGFVEYFASVQDENEIFSELRRINNEYKANKGETHSAPLKQQYLSSNILKQYLELCR